MIGAIAYSVYKLFFSSNPGFSNNRLELFLLLGICVILIAALVGIVLEQLNKKYPRSKVIKYLHEKYDTFFDVIGNVLSNI